jgi:tetratricopeptide (TPR) repeat protein
MIYVLLTVMVAAGIVGGSVNLALGPHQPTWRAWFFNLLAGIGASFLMPLFLRTVSSSLLNNVLGANGSSEDLLVFGSFCLLAAITSRKFIQSLSDKVLREIDEARQETAAFKVQVTKSDAWTAAIAASSARGTFLDREHALQMLRAAKEALGNDGLVDRQIHITMGRLQRLLGRYNEAVNMLTGFIQEKERRKQIDADLGDAYYNRACYHLVMSSEAKVAGDKTREKEHAYEDLSKAISINKENKRDAIQDEDFESIREEPRFRELVEAA